MERVKSAALLVFALSVLFIYWVVGTVNDVWCLLRYTPRKQWRAVWREMRLDPQEEGE